MAQKRMFDKRVVDSEEFYSLPIESQCLYFHLGMNADVHGFVQPLKICRLTNIKPTSLTPLIHQKFVIAVADGVILITHWNINNTVRIDREAPSPYTNLTQNLKTDEEGKYLIDGENGELLEYSGRTPAQYSIGKVSIGKNKLEENNILVPVVEKKPKKKEEASQYVGRFNELFGSKYTVTQGRIDKLSTRLKTYDLEQVLQALENLSKSKWHRGENDRKWVADPDFLLRSDEQIDKWLNVVFEPENKKKVIIGPKLWLD